MCFMLPMTGGCPQIDHARLHLDTKRRARRQQEADLRAALNALVADEVAAEQQLTAALATVQDVRSETFKW